MQTPRWLVGAFLFTTGCQAHPAPLTAHDLEVAGIPADADTAAVRRIAGTPISVTVANKPDEEGVRVTAWTYAMFEVSFDDRGRLYRFAIESPGVGTARGLQVGDDTSRISLLYGRPSMADSIGRVFSIDPESDANTSGISIIIAGGRVRSILVGYVIDVS